MPVTVHPAPANGTSSVPSYADETGLPVASASNASKLAVVWDYESNGTALVRSNGESWALVSQDTQVDLGPILDAIDSLDARVSDLETYHEQIVTSDSFNRADGNPGTTDAAYGGEPLAWVRDGSVSTTGLRIISNQLHRITGGGRHYARVPVDTPDHYVRAVVAALPEAGQQAGVRARVTDNGATGTYYVVQVSDTGVLSLVQRINGSGTTLAASAAGAVVAGNEIGLKVVGQQLTASVNGVQVLTVSSSSIADGDAGVFIANSAAARLDDFVVSTASVDSPL